MNKLPMLAALFSVFAIAPMATYGQKQPEVAIFTFGVFTTLTGLGE